MSYTNTIINHKLDKVLAEARAIKLSLKLGGITYQQAKEKVLPLLKQVNVVGRQIAKKYGRKYRDIRFTDLYLS